MSAAPKVAATRPKPSGLAMEIAAEELGPRPIATFNQEQLARIIQRGVERNAADEAFYRLAIKERDYERVRANRLEKERAGLRDELRETLRDAFYALDRMGANIITHQEHAEWDRARALLSRLDAEAKP